MRNTKKKGQECVELHNTIKMSGVHNLRAMFENKGTTDLPDRGRSPGASSMGE